MKIEEALAEVLEEYTRATGLHGSFTSSHEGWAVLKEEVDELWDEVKKKSNARNQQTMQKEATQVAAMALRFLRDIC